MGRARKSLVLIAVAAFTGALAGPFSGFMADKMSLPEWATFVAVFVLIAAHVIAMVEKARMGNSGDHADGSAGSDKSVAREKGAATSGAEGSIANSGKMEAGGDLLIDNRSSRSKQGTTTPAIVALVIVFAILVIALTIALVVYFVERADRRVAMSSPQAAPSSAISSPPAPARTPSPPPVSKHPRAAAKSLPRTSRSPEQRSHKIHCYPYKYDISNMREAAVKCDHLSARVTLIISDHTASVKSRKVITSHLVTPDEDDNGLRMNVDLAKAYETPTRHRIFTVYAYQEDDTRDPDSVEFSYFPPGSATRSVTPY